MQKSAPNLDSFSGDAGEVPEFPAARGNLLNGEESEFDGDGLPKFVAEEDPEVFIEGARKKSVSGIFPVFPRQSPADSDEADWDLDFSPVLISGEGILSGTEVHPCKPDDYGFIELLSIGGRRSYKRPIFQCGTRLNIDPAICISWAEDVVGKGWCTHYDMESLIAECEGNGDHEELISILKRNIEAAGIELVDHSVNNEHWLWDARTSISPEELAEAIEATLCRATRLPGTNRFKLDKAGEMELVNSMVKTRQDLQLGILASKDAIDEILEWVERIRNDKNDPKIVTLAPVFPDRQDHEETSRFFDAADKLRSWQDCGRVMDGKSRRQALEALDTLELKQKLQHEIVNSLKENESEYENAIWLDELLSTIEAANERLILDYLPFARRFASRNVDDGEEPEEVFQVAFGGMLHAMQRFDLKRGDRFTAYSMYWMSQAVSIWRKKESGLVRIPAHRYDEMPKIDWAEEKLDTLTNGFVSDVDLAIELGWTILKVREYRGFPRQALSPEDADEWDMLLPMPVIEDILSLDESARIVNEELDALGDRSANVLRMRYGIGRDKEMTLEEIAKIYGVTRERIRQIETKAFDKIRHPARMQKLWPKLGN